MPTAIDTNIPASVSANWEGAGAKPGYTISYKWHMFLSCVQISRPILAIDHICTLGHVYFGMFLTVINQNKYTCVGFYRWRQRYKV